MSEGLRNAAAVSDAAAFPAAEQRRGSALSLSALLGGFLLTSLYFVINQLLPDTGRTEFSFSPFNPIFHLFSPMRGFTLEQLVNHVLRVFVLGPGLLLLWLGLARMLNLSTAQTAWLGRMHWVAAGASLLTTAYVMFFVLRGRPITDDEVTYVDMAKMFARGHLAEPRIRGQVLDFFEVLTKRGITGKYLFGEPLVQMLGVLVSMPALMHLLLNAITLFALYRSVQLLWGERTLAALSCALLAISPTFMLCGATGQSQATSLCCVMLGILGYALAKRQSQIGGGVLAGAALAFGLSVRVQSLAPAGAAIGCCFIALALQTRKLRGLLSFALLSALGVGAIAAYNWALSGDPLTLPWYLQGEGVEHYGFGRVWRDGPFVHTPLGGVQNLLVVAVRMNAWWLGWPLALLLVFRRSALRNVWREGAIFVAVAAALIVFEFGYYSTGVSDVGPIYHFEILPCLSVIGAQFLLELWRNRPELAVTGVMLHLIFGTSTFVWEQSARLDRLVKVIYDNPDRALASLPDRSLLLYDLSCKNVLHLGWLHRAFALMNHDPKTRVLAYVRPSPRFAGHFIAQFPDRACYYLDHNEAFEPVVLPCNQARAQLLRPFPSKEHPDVCSYLQSSAKNLLPLFAPDMVDPWRTPDVR